MQFFKPKKYPFSMRILHWTMAVIIIGLIILGFLMGNVLTDEPYTRDLYLWHKSFGVLALMLIVLRIATRFSLKDKIPALSTMMKKYELMAAKVGHVLLYVSMVVVPVSGYLMSSAYPKSSGIFLFGIPLPDALPKNEALAQFFTSVHIVSAYILAALIVGHVAAVIKHRYFDKHRENLLKRIW
ncbi:MAG: cytochrome b [Gammaproteobacteria bacterium]